MTSKPSKRAIVYNWTQTASGHGIGHIGRAQSKPLRAFWLLLFVVAISMFTWQVYELVSRYLMYEKVTNVEVS